MIRIEPARRVSLAVAAAFFGIVAGIAPQSAAKDPPPSMRDATPDQEFLFLTGAASGITYTNTWLWMRGQRKLFCPPESYILNVEEMRRMAREKLTGPHQPTVYVLAALDRLQERFPCDQSAPEQR